MTNGHNGRQISNTIVYFLLFKYAYREFVKAVLGQERQVSWPPRPPRPTPTSLCPYAGPPPLLLLVAPTGKQMTERN